MSGRSDGWSITFSPTYREYRLGAAAIDLPADVDPPLLARQRSVLDRVGRQFVHDHPDGLRRGGGDADWRSIKQDSLPHEIAKMSELATDKLGSVDASPLTLYEQ